MLGALCHGAQKAQATRTAVTGNLTSAGHSHVTVNELCYSNFVGFVLYDLYIWFGFVGVWELEAQGVSAWFYVWAYISNLILRIVRVRKGHMQWLFSWKGQHMTQVWERVTYTNKIALYIAGFDKEVVIGDVQLHSFSGLVYWKSRGKETGRKWGIK